MNIEDLDWQSLERLRRIFLEGSAHEVYWESESDIEHYDRTFAQRIGWKWQHVLDDLSLLGWQPPKGEVMDWGCGSGIATRRFLQHFGADATSRVTLWDHSPHAIQLAARKIEASFGNLPISKKETFYGETGTLLISHVITELSEWQLGNLLELAGKAETIIWVEPGTYESSRSLIAVREALSDTFNLVAPCTHQAACGMRRSENELHWCHFFAETPQEAFTESGWSKFAKLMGIDLRHLPLSYLVLDKRPVAALPENLVRVIGNARIYKAHALVQGCTASGVEEKRLMKRYDAQAFRAFKKGKFPTMQRWFLEKGDIVKLDLLSDGNSLNEKA
ncbi:Ribosomal small subunit Rsm22 [Chloroherpeton thalassium ATCC 35110]|uniref:Ribosomal small subunit Rsm22 n=1 Tax=Chloroherpeton thalassium (strain ATCC 35110 / GB-78) TaxID=517418 RepID=B3QSJ0_CHLT3|nr:small ribosomal subunit Rsm22 family protein [Chloroherpeton thalassium]ACF14037.1 Ribosomal small subunit Rsm22 [Chloroherpeton thalassium ATCC 35110]